MIRRLTLIVGAGLVASFVLACAVGARPGPREPGTPLLVLTGHQSEIGTPRYRRARGQESFDAQWIEHMGERVQRAAQGWPMTPRVDFTACEAVFIFGGNGLNANGYRVLEVLDAPDAVTIRYERISYQTASLAGPDRGVAVRPWAMLLLPVTDRTIRLEENVQDLIGREPVWKPRSALPGGVGAGRRHADSPE